MKKSSKELVQEIDDFYFKCKKDRESRMGLVWGKWSAKMNTSIRERLKSQDPESVRLKYVMIYWVLRSQLLELFYKHRLFRRNEKKNLQDQLRDIKELILTDSESELPEVSEKKLTETIINSKRTV